MKDDEPVLSVDSLSMQFSGVRALAGVTLDVGEGELLGLLGPNGSGKTTLLNCVSGILRPSDGRIYFRGDDVTGARSSKLYVQGLARTFQLPQLFRDMTVVENVLLGCQESHETMWQRLLTRSDIHLADRVSEVLEFLRLSHVAHLEVKNLSYGQQKLVDMATALVSEPQVLLLDEPMAGVNPALIGEIENRLIELHERGLTIIIIEHNMKVIMRLCKRLVVLDAGEKIAEGTPKEIQQDQRVLRAYFGG